MNMKYLLNPILIGTALLALAGCGGEGLPIEGESWADTQLALGNDHDAKLFNKYFTVEIKGIGKIKGVTQVDCGRVKPADDPVVDCEHKTYSYAPEDYRNFCMMFPMQDFLLPMKKWYEGAGSSIPSGSTFDAIIIQPATESVEAECTNIGPDLLFGAAI